MLFNSLAFFIFFIVVFTGILILRNRNYQHFFLLMASLYFYWYSSGSMFILLLFSLLMDFNLGKVIHNSQSEKVRKFYIIASLIGNLGILFVFKYTNFFIDTFNFLTDFLNGHFRLPNLNIILPIGISFYTFQSLSYTLDIYKRQLKPCTSLLQYSLFVTFFPQLVAGPIVRAADFLPQLENKVQILPEKFKIGLTYVGWGLVKKVVFADNIAVFAEKYFSNPMIYDSSIPVFLGALAFGIQIYCDFSGYSDIAVGLAKIFGFELRLNFDKPYLATNISDFWRRWHISLSTFLRDYLYIPLGGNRKGKIRRYINLMITMALGGLWHGAAWNFLFWGFYQGMILSLHRVASILGINKILSVLRRGGVYLSLIITQYFVFLGWLIFRVSDVKNLFFLIRKFIILDFSNGLNELYAILNLYTLPLIFIALFLIFHIYTFFNRDILDRIANRDLFYWSLYLLIVCLMLYFLAAPRTIQFIYFQF